VTSITARGAPAGYNRWMKRDELLALTRSASSPNDIASAFAAARSWLAEHPEDEDVRRAVQELARQEREHWGLSYI
jgi:hypothetical protein